MIHAEETAAQISGPAGVDPFPGPDFGRRPGASLLAGLDRAAFRTVLADVRPGFGIGSSRRAPGPGRLLSLMVRLAGFCATPIWNSRLRDDRRKAVKRKPVTKR